MVLVAMSVAAPTSSFAADPPMLELYGADEVLWIYRHNLELESDEHPRQFAYRRAADPRGKTFLPLLIDAVRGQVKIGAACGSDLHVFFGDGTHRRYVPRRISWSRTPSPTQFPELSLPSAALPLALAGDRSRGVLYVAVEAYLASGAGDADSELLGPWQADERGDSAIPRAAGMPTDFAIVRYEGNRWVKDRNIPADVTFGVSLAALLVDEGQIHLLYRPGKDASASLIYRFSAAPDKPWGDACPVSAGPDAKLAGSGWTSGRPTVMLTQRYDEGESVYSVALIDGVWEAKPHLLDESGAPARFSGLAGVAAHNQSIAIAHLDDAGVVQVGLWSGETGIAVEQSAPVLALSHPMSNQGDVTVRLLIQYGILAGMLVVVFFWRRERILDVAPMQPGQAISRLCRRSLAMAIDITVLFPVWGLTLYTLWVREAGGFTLAEWLPQGAQDMTSWVYWSKAVIGAIVSVYAAILEVVIGATLGKWLLGLKVTGEGATRCSFATLVVRNLVRIVEFQFPPLILLLAVTPAQQRLGDILARTEVVESANVPPADAGKPDDKTGPDYS